jgi:uncharacterized membrane protein YqhA
MNKILARARYAIVIPSVASILSALLLMMQGSVEMIRLIVDVAVHHTKIKLTIVAVLTAVDGILLGTVLLVIGYGLYELFINENLDVPAWLAVRDLDDLKSKLTGVVVAIISVIFVGVFVDTTRASDVIACGVGAGAILTGLAFFAFATRKEETEKGKRG